jgi:hypothetical protein
MVGLPMDVLVSTLGLTPAVVTEVIDELLKRKITVSHILLITTKGAMLSYHILRVDFNYGYYAGKNIKIEPPEILPIEDIYRPKDCETFRNRLQKIL